MLQTRLGEKAKVNLIKFVGECDKRLETYWENEIDINFGYNKSQKELVKKILLHAKEHNLRAGKRLRASFVWYGYMLGKKSGINLMDSRLRGNDKVDLGVERRDIWKVCEAVEMVHTALLMHDDFMDKDEVRRGKPTTQVVFGENDAHYGEAMAVNIGDAVLCLGFERLMESGFENEVLVRVMKKLLRGIANTAFGQAYDVSLPMLGEMTEEKVMSLHRAKTAIYTYENPLIIGAILGEVPEKGIDLLKKYSEFGGIAFQIQDDILGVYGDEEKTGKSNNSDLLQGKVTLLIVKALELGTEVQKAALLKVWGKGGVESRSSMVDDRDIEEAKRAIKESGSYEYSVKKGKELAEFAVTEAKNLRKLNLGAEGVDYIEGIASYMVEREV